MARTLLLILLLSLGGCEWYGAAAQMNRDLADGDKAVEQAEDALDFAEAALAAAKEAEANGQPASPAIIEAEAELAVIRTQLAVARAKLAEAREKIPLIKNAGVQFADWMGLFELWAWILIIGGVIFLLIHTGAGGFIAKLFQAAGMFIPKVTQLKAEEDFKLLQTDTPRREDIERHTRRKLTNPGYRRTYEKLSKDADA